MSTNHSFYAFWKDLLFEKAFLKSSIINNHRRNIKMWNEWAKHQFIQNVHLKQYIESKLISINVCRIRCTVNFSFQYLMIHYLMKVTNITLHTYKSLSIEPIAAVKWVTFRNQIYPIFLEGFTHGSLLVFQVDFLGF